MKLNIWQVLGVLMVIAGLIGLAYQYGYLGTTQPAP